MSRYDAYGAPSGANTGSFPKSERQDEQGSQSSSDDGYPNFVDAQVDLEDDDNSSLTSQTLNADGTPKRPMNAFMIFARKRRPQVAAAHPSMRTGEISKLLSREWIAMAATEKQFYQDCAKQLKDEFNKTWPDYVYRRRPNNSRRRRKTDGSVTRTGDTPLQSEAGDDPGGVGDLGESSIDGEGLSAERASEVSYSRLSHDASQGYSGSFVPSQSKAPSYAYTSSNVPYRPDASQGNRVQYVPASQTPTVPSSRIPQSQQQPLNYQYQQRHPQSSSLYGTEQNDGRGNWEQSINPGRAGPPGWVTGNPDRSVPLISVPKSHSYATASPQSGTWPSSAAAVPVGPGGSSAPHPQSYPFPTLNSPFYPDQAHGQGNYSNSPSSASSHSTSPTQYPGHMQTPLTGRPGYDHRSYAPSPSDSPTNPYPSNSNRDQMYQQQQPRHPGVPRGPPRVPSMSSSSQSQSMQPSPNSASAMGYWPRDKMSGP